MNTPTHFLMTAAMRRVLSNWDIPRSAVWLGSVAPDIPLYLLSFGSLLHYRFIAGWTITEAADYVFGVLYFEDPVWIALHNWLHSPVSLAGMWVLNALFVRSPVWKHWIRWFLAACALHAVVDIFTHYDDGPVLLWPLNWKLRFHSPISYWDHRHFGNEASKFELVLVVALCFYLLSPWWLRWIRRDHRSRGKEE